MLPEHIEPSAEAKQLFVYKNVNVEDKITSSRLCWINSNIFT